MIPVATNSLLNLTVTTRPSLTYGWDSDNNRIIGKIDGQRSILQYVKKVLLTQRYSFPTNSGNYGSETEKLVGKDYDYIISEVERIIKETLLVDDRIQNISNFKTKLEGNDTMLISFRVNSVNGDIFVESEVRI